MNDRADNLLLRIRKYAAIPENLLSEAFANLLRQIAEERPSEASKIVGKLTDGAIDVPEGEWDRVVISTQISADANNYPDIEIRNNDFICWIEAKDGGEPEENQLQRYHRLLDLRPETSKTLVSLTRSRILPVELPLLGPAVGWSQVAVWLNDALSGDSDVNPVVDYLITEFLNFLGGIDMTVDKVGFELISGVQQLRNMQSLVREALELESGVRPHSAGSMDTLSYFVPDANGTMAFAAILYFNKPESLGFEAHDGFISTSSNWGDDWDVSRKGWRKRELDLEAEEVHFFALSVSSQTALVRQFLRECLDQVGHESGKRAVRV
jgi:hypothetical protein